MASNVYKIEWEGSVYEIEAESEEEAYSALPGYGAAPAAPPPPQQAPVQQERPTLANTQQRATDTFGKTAADDGLDIAATLGSSALALVPSGIAGVAGAALPGEQGQGARWQQAVQGAATWSPKTKGGQAVLGSAGEKMEWLSTNIIQPIMETASRVPLTPGELVKAGLKMLDGEMPDKSPLKASMAEAIAGTFMPGKTAVKAGAAKTALSIARKFNREAHDNAAKRLGIDLENSTIKDSVKEAVRTQAGGGEVKPMSGDLPLSRATVGAEDIQTVVKAEEAASRKAVNEGYTFARSKNAAIAYEPIAAMVARTREDFHTRGVRVDEMSVLDKRLKEIEVINDQIIGRTGPGAKRARPGSSQTILGPDGKPLPVDQTPVRVPLNELESVIQTISGNIKDARGRGDFTEAAALSQLRRDMNDMLDQQFIKDMVYGDKDAKAAWNAATLANQRHKGRFSDDKVIATIVKNEMTSAQVAKLVLGASESGHRLEAASIVKALKGIMGNDAAELQSLKSAVYLDMFDPIFKDTPNWSGALERMRKIRKNEGQLLDELGISGKDLDFFEQAIKVASKVKTAADFDAKGWFSQAWSKLLFGHDIARAGLMVKTANLIADRALGVGQKTHARLLSEFADDAGVTSVLANSLNPTKTRQVLEKAALAAYIDREKDQRDR